LSGNSWWKLPRSGSGNGKVAAVTPGGSHRPSRCRDDDCGRLLCQGYKLGYPDGFEDGYGAGAADGYETGYGEGYAAGAASCE
jgi:hypothetical protein